MQEKLKILIVCENATDLYGGEAILPLHYFRFLRKQGYGVWLITHARVRERLEQLIPGDLQYVIFIPETRLHRLLYKIGKKLPPRIDLISFSALSHLVTQYYQFKLARKAVKQHAINIVHEPAPVSPKNPSSLFCLGAPVIIGPMNGGMNFPPGFSCMESKSEKVLYAPMRILAHFVNFILPGKLFAKVLLVANKRTQDALPMFTNGKQIMLVENAVDNERWELSEHLNDKTTIDFIFLGRLTDWKCCDLLIQAFEEIHQKYSIKLTVVGDGDDINHLKHLASNMIDKGAVRFTGWLSPTEAHKILSASDVLVLPSVRECGGAVVLEAMALSKPVIAVNWGGPADYITAQTGILIEPEGPEQLVRELIVAMEKMIMNPILRGTLGEAGYRRLMGQFTWQEKIVQIVEIYQQVVDEQN